METELALEVVNTEWLIMPFPLSHTKGHQAATDMLELGWLGARWTARQAELVLAHADHLFDLGAEAIELPDRRRG